MIIAPEILITSFLKNQLKILSNCREEVEFVLCGYRYPDVVKDLVGDGYMKEAVDFIMNNKIEVHPYYNTDLQKAPMISVLAEGSENNTFIGQGSYLKVADIQPEKRVIAEFSATAAPDGVKLPVSPEKKLDEKLWPGLIVKNGDFESTIDVIASSSLLCLNDEIPEGLPQDGWKVSALGNNRVYSIGKSTSNVSVSCIITTSGAPAINTLVSQITRFILQKGRIWLSHSGFQNIHVGFTPMKKDQYSGDDFFSSTVSIRGDVESSWIQSIHENPGPNTRINSKVVVTRYGDDN